MRADEITPERKKKIARHIEIMMAAHEDAEKKGLRKGHGGVSAMTCLCGGTLHYAVASLNGHLWGRCNSCGVSWME